MEANRWFSLSSVSVLFKCSVMSAHYSDDGEKTAQHPCTLEAFESQTVTCTAQKLRHWSPTKLSGMPTLTPSYHTGVGEHHYSSHHLNGRFTEDSRHQSNASALRTPVRMRPSPPPVTNEDALRGPGWVEDSSQAGLETQSCPIAVFQVLWEPV